MSKLSLYDFFKANSSLFKLNYSGAVKHANPDSIHDLRVSIKRLHALVLLLNFDNRANFRVRSSYQYLKQVFRAAANVRDFQVLSDLLTYYNKFKDLNLRQLSTRIGKCKNDTINFFFQQAGEFDLLAISRFFVILEKHIQKFTENQLDNQFNSFIVYQIEMLNRFSNPVSKIYNLHSARKSIKNLGYLVEMSGNSTHPGLLSLPIYKDAGRFLGEWHDRLVLQNFIRQNSKYLMNGSIDNLLKLLNDEKEALKDQYFNLLKTIVKEPEDLR